MKYIVVFVLCMALAAPCFAGSCQDMQEAVGGAIQERNGRVSETHDVLMPAGNGTRRALGLSRLHQRHRGRLFSRRITAEYGSDCRGHL